MKARNEREEKLLAELAKRPTTPKVEGGLRRSESGDPYEGIPNSARVLVICPKCGNREEVTVGVMKRIRQCAGCGMKVNRARIFAARAEEVERGWREEERRRLRPRIFAPSGKRLH
jgi:hypothetical protein